MAIRELTPAAPRVDISSSFLWSHVHLATSFPLDIGVPFSGSGRCGWALDSCRNNVPLSEARSFTGQKRIVEKLWREFFSDPSQWWDNRPTKVNAKHPDFKHKTAQDALWLYSKLKPQWVEAELAALKPGTLHMDISSWNRRLSRSVKSREYKRTMKLFQQMQQEGMIPDTYSFVSVLNACASLGALEEGRRIHTQIIESGYESHAYVRNSLVDMYSKCRTIDDAWIVFTKIPTPSVVTWSSMIMGYVRCGQGQKALELFQRMEREGVEPDNFTFVGVLNACACLRSLEEGRRVHEQVIQRGFESDLFVGSSLIDMYAKCGSIEDAWTVFNKMPTHNGVVWNAMILGYVKCAQLQKALELSRQMQKEGVKPGSFTFVGILNACTSLASIEEGRRVHEYIIESGCESNVFVANGLINMYTKCGSLEDARRIFKKMRTRNVVSWNLMILGHVKCGQGQKALDLYKQFQQDGFEPNSITFVGAVNACASVVSLEEGRCVHKQIIEFGLEFNLVVANSLIDMYSKCGSLEDSCGVFNKMPNRDVVSWNTMIKGYVKCGQGQQALELSKIMQGEGVEPDAITFVGILNACASIPSLEEGSRVHGQIIESGCESDMFLGNALIDMYSKCGSIEDAWRAFNKMTTHDVVSWNTMIQGYANCGQGQKALELSRQMKQEGFEPDSVTFVAVLNACVSVASIEEGRCVHKQIIQKGYQSDLLVGNSLMKMYLKCGSIEDAWRVFENMPTHNVVSWTTMILGHVKCGQGQKALDLCQQMQSEGVHLGSITFVGLVNACAYLGELQEGKHVHEQIIKSCFDSDIFVGNSLVDMYAKCGSIENAWNVFSTMPERNVISWNAIILGYVNCGQAQRALELYQQMCTEGLEPDLVTFLAVLKACGSVVSLKEGKRVHKQILVNGFESNILVGNSLINMYSKCGSMEDAWREFNKMPIHTVVSWNAMIHGCVQCGQGQKALDLFQNMQKEGLEPDIFTFVGVLNACASVASLEKGMRVHEQIIDRGYQSDKFVGNGLINMYVKCGSIKDAWREFNKMPKHDVISWNTMILGYVKCGQGHKALEISRQMPLEGVEADTVTFKGLINACSSVGALDEGKRVHEQIIQNGYDSDVFLGNALVNMYAKCGSIEDACCVFEKMSVRDVVSWNTMLGAYAMHGHGKEALELFERMCQEGLYIGALTFVFILSACCHAGLVDEGVTYFESMSTVHGVSARVVHYSWMVNLLCRAGRLQEAEALIKRMSCKPDASMWLALFGACRLHGNVVMGERVARQLHKLDAGNTMVHTLLSNSDVATGKWDRTSNLKQQKLRRPIKKQPGCTWMEVNNELQSFTTGDRKHPQIGEIHLELERLSRQLEEAGYVPDTNSVLHHAHEEKVHHHSEKLAISFGLISTPPGTTLRIFKTLWVCGNCHAAIKLITKIVGRTIIVRDARRFHHFKDGLCSCKDYL